jgi:hypothetical protein
MCNLYSLIKGQAAIRDWFHAKHDRTGNLPLFARICPDQFAPIVRSGADGARDFVPHEAEQEAIHEIVALRAQGRPLSAITAAMVAGGGFKISHEGVAGVSKAARGGREGFRGLKPVCLKAPVWLTSMSRFQLPDFVR